MARNMTDHMLTPLKHFYKGSHLVTNGAVDATQAGLSEYSRVPAGRCLHLTNATGPGEVPTAKLGCDGNEKLPVWLFRDSDSYSAGQAGAAPDSTTYNGPSWSNGVEQRLLMFVGLEGFELSTTEFDSAQVYKVGEYLVAPEETAADATDIQDVAGVATNQAANNGGVIANGAHCIIGIVSPGVSSPMAGDYAGNENGDEFGNDVLSFYTTYRPQIAALAAGVTNLA